VGTLHKRSEYCSGLRAGPALYCTSAVCFFQYPRLRQ
jgi:hypothetical protein